MPSKRKHGNANTIAMPRGPVMIDVEGFYLSDVERERLKNPYVGGVILFRRNFQTIEQLRTLCQDIRNLRDPALLIAVDHEGGRVQRFLEGFTRLPPMQALGEQFDVDAAGALDLAQQIGDVLATELRAIGVDLSFAPVLDLDWERSGIIGDRAFSSDPDKVAQLASALCSGLNRGGMASCGKHFPGHGWVVADSHHAIPVDERSLAELEAHDLKPFAALIEQGMEALMPAHVVYEKIDDQPAGFSRFWLKQYLREKLGFNGLIFSDDLCMEGAAGAGDIVARAQAAWAAGCDMVLVCNRPDLAQQLLNALEVSQQSISPTLADRLARIEGAGSIENAQRKMNKPEFAHMQAQAALLAVPPEQYQNSIIVGEAHY